MNARGSGRAGQGRAGLACPLPGAARVLNFRSVNVNLTDTHGVSPVGPVKPWLQMRYPALVPFIEINLKA